MSRHIRIKTEIDNLVHVDAIKNNYTLCGLETGGDGGLGIEVGKITPRKVDCPDCIEVILFCKAIKSTEYKKL